MIHSTDFMLTYHLIMTVLGYFAMIWMGGVHNTSHTISSAKVWDAQSYPNAFALLSLPFF